MSYHTTNIQNVGKHSYFNSTMATSPFFRAIFWTLQRGFITSSNTRTLADVFHRIPSESTSCTSPIHPPISFTWCSIRYARGRLYSRTQNGQRVKERFEGCKSPSTSLSKTRFWSKVQGRLAVTLDLSRRLANWATKKLFSIVLKNAPLDITQIWFRVRSKHRN